MANEYLEQLKETIDKIDLKDLEAILNAIRWAKANNRCVYIVGNGGSSSTASHFANDLLKSCNIKAIAIDSTPIITAFGNDDGYSKVYSFPMLTLVENGDIVIGISCSGNSINILDAMLVANTKGAITISLTAFNGGYLKRKTSFNINVPIDNYEQAEDAHLAICHMIKNELRTNIEKNMDGKE